MQNQFKNTIFAPSTGSGRSAIAVVRISGPECLRALRAVCPGETPQDRVATLRTLTDPETGEALDRALVIRFEGPRSFTGEDMAELQITGGRAVVSGVMSALSKIPGLRPADPGEFAWRAFENGKLDLSAVEGLADLVEAETAAQRRQALRIAGGALRREAEAIRDTLVAAMATLEAQIDFSDVEDAQPYALSDVRKTVEAAVRRIRSNLASARAGERLRDGLNVVIAGPPNAGKSTLMNALSRREVSIVSSTPGTTRDIIEVSLDLSGYPVTLIDTAGIRETLDPVEREGVTRAWRRAEMADLTLWLQDHGAYSGIEPFPGIPTIFVATKCDEGEGRDLAPQAIDKPVVQISAQTGLGLANLLDEIGRFAADQLGDGSGALITAERHRLAFEDAEAALMRSLEPSLDLPELVAEDLRLAARALERIAGRIDAEEVLSSIFSRLCVGK